MANGMERMRGEGEKRKRRERKKGPGFEGTSLDCVSAGAGPTVSRNPGEMQILEVVNKKGQSRF